MMTACPWTSILAIGMEKLVRRHSRPVEGRGEQDIEIEQGKWRDQEIGLVYITEFHRFYALSSQDRDSGQYHPKQQNDCQCSEIFWHQNSPGLRLTERIFSIGADTSALRRAMKQEVPIGAD